LPQTRYVVEDLAVDQATFNAQAVDLIDGKAPFSLGAGAHRVTLYPGQQPLPMATLTLQEGINGYSGTRDTFVDGWNPTTGYGGAAQVRLRSPNVRNGLVRFDLGSVPPQALGNGVRGAALSFHTSSRSNNNSSEMVAYPLSRTWIEGQATWQQAAAGQPWSQPGANGVPGDRSGAALDSRLLDSINVRWGLDVTDAVLGWLANPAGNYGLLLRGADPDVEYAISSRENSAVEQRPRLLIVYPLATPTATPSPTPTRPTPTEPHRHANAHGHAHSYSYRYGHADRNPVAHAGDRRHPGGGLARRQPESSARPGRTRRGRRDRIVARGRRHAGPDPDGQRWQLWICRPGCRPLLYGGAGAAAQLRADHPQPAGGVGDGRRVDPGRLRRRVCAAAGVFAADHPQRRMIQRLTMRKPLRACPTPFSSG
jgi:hypothetical protein